MALRPLHILLVEDSADMVALLREGAAQASMDVRMVVAQSCGAAVEHLRAAREAGGRRFDGVLLDLWLPDGHGSEVLAALRPERGDPPAIVFSYDDDPDQRLLCERLGAARYLVKPFTLRGLLDVMQEAHAVFSGDR